MADNSQSSTMEDTVSSTASAGSRKKVASTKVIEPKVKSHPRTSEMVLEAIKEIGERDGSSLFAIKKYIALIYKLDTEKKANSIKKYLRAAVASGELVQTKGKGASGSFKLPSEKSQTVNRKESKLVDAEAEKNAAAKKSSKTDSAKLSSSTNKLASSKVDKKESLATLKNAKTAKSALPKSSKAKKLARSPTTKPKAPKPKKVGAGA